MSQAGKSDVNVVHIAVEISSRVSDYKLEKHCAAFWEQGQVIQLFSSYWPVPGLCAGIQEIEKT